jgi:hypothetical protein
VTTQSRPENAFAAVTAVLATSRDHLDPLSSDHVQPAQLRGRSGYVLGPFSYYGSSNFATLVELDDGRWLQVRSYPGVNLDDPEVMIQITNELVIGPNPDLAWIGRR